MSVFLCYFHCYELSFTSYTIIDTRTSTIKIAGAIALTTTTIPFTFTGTIPSSNYGYKRAYTLSLSFWRDR